MENCLVTKLKESINNNDLPRLNYLRVSPRVVSGNQTKIDMSENEAGYRNVIVYGDNVVSYNSTTHQNESYNQYIAKTDDGISRIIFTQGTTNGGYIDINLENVDTNKLIFRPQNIFINKTLEDLKVYSDYLVIYSLYNYGNIFTGENKLSTLSNIVKSNPQKYISDVKSIMLMSSNVIPDDTSVEFLGLLTSCNSLWLKTGSYSWNPDVNAIADAQVSNGRNSGSLVLYTSTTDKTVKFGSSMENPTSEESTQGWQVI